MASTALTVCILLVASYKINRALSCSDFIWNLQTSFENVRLHLEMFKLHLEHSNFIWFIWNLQTSFGTFKLHLKCSNFIWNLQTSFGIFKLHFKCSNFIWNLQTAFEIFKLYLVTCGLCAVMWITTLLQQLLNAENIACPEVAPYNGAIHPELKQQLGCESNYPHLSRHADFFKNTFAGTLANTWWPIQALHTYSWLEPFVMPFI